MIDGEISCYGGPRAGTSLVTTEPRETRAPSPMRMRLEIVALTPIQTSASNPAIPGNMVAGGYKRPCTQLGAVSNMDQMVQLDTLLKQRNICGENALGHPALGTDFHRIFNYHESHIF